MNSSEDIEWVVDRLAGSTVRLIAGQLRERAATVRDEALQARDHIAELDVARLDGDLSRNEYEEIDDEIAEAENVVRLNSRLADALIVIASDLARLDRERESR